MSLSKREEVIVRAVIDGKLVDLDEAAIHALAVNGMALAAPMKRDWSEFPNNGWSGSIEGEDATHEAWLLMNRDQMLAELSSLRDQNQEMARENRRLRLQLYGRPVPTARRLAIAVRPPSLVSTCRGHNTL